MRLGRGHPGEVLGPALRGGRQPGPPRLVVQHLGERREGSPDFVWHWPLLALRRAGTLAIVEQIMPQTFLRTRLVTHVFGGRADEHRQAAGTIKHVCERLQADRAAGALPEAGNALLAGFHSRLAGS